MTFGTVAMARHVLLAVAPTSNAGEPMTTVRANRSADHPSKDPADHANLDPRRSVKHPKQTERQRRDSGRPDRGRD